MLPSRRPVLGLEAQCCRAAVLWGLVEKHTNNVDPGNVTTN